jgi:hypothetical protein
MDLNYPALSAYSHALPSVSAASTDSAAHRKLFDALRAETTRLIVLDSQRCSSSAAAGDVTGITSLLCTARDNISNSIHNVLETGKCRDVYDIEKTIRLDAELPAAFVSLDEDFRRWSASVSCPMRTDVEMVHA